MPESFDHRQHRDQFARDLLAMKDHGERREALRSELTSRRYQEAQKQHDIDTAPKRAELHKSKEFQRKEANAIEYRLQRTPIGDILHYHPELASRMEAIPVEKNGWGLSLLRDKNFPETAIAIWSDPTHVTGTRGHVAVPVQDQRIANGWTLVRYQALCGCASCRVAMLGLPSGFDRPEWKPPSIGESQKYPTIEEYKEEIERYRALHEDRVAMWEKHTAPSREKWIQEQEAAFRPALQKACHENGIRHLVMRHPWWLDGMDGVEITKLASEEADSERSPEGRKFCFGVMG